MSVKLKQVFIFRPQVTLKSLGSMPSWTEVGLLDGGTINPWNTTTSYSGGTISPWSTGYVFDGGSVGGSDVITFRILD